MATPQFQIDPDPGNDREDDISDDEYSDHDDQLEDDHSLPSQQFAEQDEADEHAFDQEPNDNDDDVEVQGNHFDNAGTDNDDYIGDSDDDYVEDANDEVLVGIPGVDEAVENPEVETVEETRRSSRFTREPQRFADTEHSSVFFQAVSQYQNVQQNYYSSFLNAENFTECKRALFVSDLCTHARPQVFIFMQKIRR